MFAGATTPMSLTAAPPSPMSTRPMPVPKVSKQAARYRKGTPARNCGNCRYMHDDGTCTKVAGQVSRTMTSDYWQAERKLKP